MIYYTIFRKVIFYCTLVFPGIVWAQHAFNESTDMDISASGEIRTWKNGNNVLGENTFYKSFNESIKTDTSNIGIFWWDARDIQRIEVIYESSAKGLSPATVQYWQHSWPETPPKMPTKEDLEDDAWRGKWIDATTVAEIKPTAIVYRFKPLSVNENRNAAYLPRPVPYRRTLKVRLVFAQKQPPIKTIRFFSMSKQKTNSIRIEFGCNQTKKIIYDGQLEIFNGRIIRMQAWHFDKKDYKTTKNSWKINIDGKAKGIVAHILSAQETLPGSNDETIVTVRSRVGTFSFSMNDVQKGPVYIPYFNTYITKADDPVYFSISTARSQKGQTIRERIREQPEQTYDRAKKEIPELDPTHRDGRDGMEIDLPLACDASWQKFSVKWGGNVVIDKKLAKVKGKQLERCNWTGNTLKWSFGTGIMPIFHRTTKNCQVSFLNGYLPVLNTRWLDSQLVYDQQAFVTFLHGPLSPDDPTRNEQTPAILMIKLTVSNPSLRDDTANIWLAANDVVDELILSGNNLYEQKQNTKYFRGFIQSGIPKENLIELLKDSTGEKRTIYQKLFLKANTSKDLYFYFPFVGDLNFSYQDEIAALDYENEKKRVVSYWRNIIAQHVVYDVPERKFNEMAKAALVHVLMSATKDPQSGFYMVPAASLEYGVYANESIFQTVLLDRVGDFTTASKYLKTLTELQGSRSLPGSFIGDQNDVFYGVKVDSLNDLTADGYNMHHGTVLWGLAHHYLLSKDSTWLKVTAPHMIRAANWIIDQRNSTKQLDLNGNKVKHYGLLPAGLLEDATDWRYWYATNAYASLGLTTMAEAFKKAGIPEATYYQSEALSYQNDLRYSIQKSIELSPVVRLRNNVYVPYVPSRPYQRLRYFGTRKAAYYDRYEKGIYPALRRSATREVLYGPIVLVKTGIIDVGEPMVDWILDDWEDNLTLSTSLNSNVHGWVDDQYWFSRGGMAFQPNLQNPISIYLMKGEIVAAIRCLYNNMVSCLYPDVNAQTEEYRQWVHGSGPFYKIPDEARFVSQICDLLVMEKDQELWLANGVPERWLEPGEKITLSKAYTQYGKISYSMNHGAIKQTIEAEIDLPENKCSKVLLFVRAPFQIPIKSVMINGEPWTDFDSEKKCIVIPQTTKKVGVVISY